MAMRIGKEEFTVDGQKIVVEGEGANLWEDHDMTFTVKVNAGDGNSSEEFDNLMDALTAYRKECRRFRILERESYERQEVKRLQAELRQLRQSRGDLVEPPVLVYKSSMERLVKSLDGFTEKELDEMVSLLR